MQTMDIKELKKLKLEAVRDFHQDLIDDLDIPRTDFNMKMPFYDKHGADRKVYRVPFNSSYEDEYELNEKGSYLVPLEELRVVNPTSVAIKKTASFDLEKEHQSNTRSSLNPVPMQAYKAPAAMEDAPYSEMTIRDYYAIQTGKPVSSKTWLNELIKSTK